jgi:hypothetical protein
MTAATQRSTREDPGTRGPLKLRIGVHEVLLVLVFAIAIVARAWEFGRLPPGLNADEASNGIDALSLYRYGLDRNGVSFPVKFTSWGGGQDALYGYLLIPLVATLGLTPTVVRLPMLLVGVASLPLLYIAARRMFGSRIALLATSMLAISPWHILLSRWGLEANLFPILFLAGFACLLHIRGNGRWFSAACVLFALCLYAYGTAYAFIPVFMACALVMIMRTKLLRRMHLILGLACFLILAAPIALLVLINGLDLPSMSLGPITIPRFPVAARWETTTVLGSSDVAGTLGANVWTGLRLLAVESDGILYSVVDPFGYFYRIGLLLAIAGVTVLLVRFRVRFTLESGLLLAWLGAALLIAALQSVNVNRFNIVFLPLLLFGAYGLDFLHSRHPAFLPASIFTLTAAFLAFSLAYHGEPYRRQADSKFNQGILGALAFARQLNTEHVCVTDKVTQPYIYTLFSEPMDPRDFARTVQYLDAQDPLRRVGSYGRYTFGSRRCAEDGSTAYVLRAEEIPPRFGNRFQYEFFDGFVVYYPR